MNEHTHNPSRKTAHDKLAPWTIWLIPAGAFLCVGIAATVAIAAANPRVVLASTVSDDSTTVSARVAISSSARQSTQAPAPATAPSSTTAPAPDPAEFTVATGAVLTIRMIDSIDSKVNRAGDVFHASLDEAVLVNNSVVVPRGTDVYVRLVQSTTAGSPNNANAMHLQLVKLDFEGRSYSLVSSTYSAAGKMKAKHAGRDIGGGAIFGTILGAAIGGGRGAAVGAVVGATGGGVYADTHRSQQVKVPAETRLDFTLEQPVTITVMGHTANASDNIATSRSTPSGNPPAAAPANANPPNANSGGTTPQQ